MMNNILGSPLDCLYDHNKDRNFTDQLDIKKLPLSEADIRFCWLYFSRNLLNIFPYYAISYWEVSGEYSW
jgi:hypothetical protein